MPSLRIKENPKAPEAFERFANMAMQRVRNAMEQTIRRMGPQTSARDDLLPMWREGLHAAPPSEADERRNALLV